MAGETRDHPVKILQVVQDPALGTPGAPGLRPLTLAELTASGGGGGGGGGGTTSGLPAVYGSVVFAGPLTVTSAWTTVIDREVPTATTLKRLFYNPSDEMIELYLGTAPGAIDHTGLELPAKPQGPATPSAAPAIIAQSNSGGAIAAGTYFYKATSVDVNGLESAPTPSSVGVTVTGTAQATMAVPAAARGVKYRWYRSTVAGSELLIAETRAPILFDVGATAAVGDGYTLATPLSTGVQPSSIANPMPWDFRDWKELNVNADIAARHYGSGNKTLIVVEFGA